METLPASQEDFDKLVELLAFEDLEDEDFIPHGMEVEYYDGAVHMFDGESGSLEDVSNEALAHIGQMIRKAGKAFWEFGISYTASRAAPGSRGGCYARIMPDGSRVFSLTTWPKPMETLDHLKAVGDKPFKINGYRRTDGSVVNLKVRLLKPEGYKALIKESIECMESFGKLLDATQYELARESVLASLQKSLEPGHKPERVSYEVITSVTDNVALLDDDPDKVIVFRVEIIDTETLEPPVKVTKSRDATSEAKKQLTAVLPIGRFCFRLNLYKGNYASVE